jgi:hypothetical protein
MDASDRAQQGKVVITIGLEAGSIKFTSLQLARAVRRVADASVVTQVGITQKWGREDSAQVVVFNMGADGRPRFSWISFLRYCRLLAERLARLFAQEVTVLESVSSTGAYALDTYAEDPAEVARARERIGAARRKNPVREWRCSIRGRVRIQTNQGTVIASAILVRARSAELAAREAAKVFGRRTIRVERA